MEITTDVLLKGPVWAEAIEGLSNIFNYKNRVNYNIFVICIALGIMYDKVIENPENPDSLNPRNVPRNVMMNAEQETSRLEFMFQTAILNTKTISLPEEKRMEYAFGDSGEFKKLDFLVGFANYGVTKLRDLISDNSIETMDNIRDFLNSTIEGYNYELDDIPDEILIEDE